MIVCLLCIIGILTSFVVALRRTRARQQTLIMKPQEDVVYDEISKAGVNPIATQVMLKENSAYGGEVTRKYEDEYVHMM